MATWIETRFCPGKVICFGHPSWDIRGLLGNDTIYPGNFFDLKPELIPTNQDVIVAMTFKLWGSRLQPEELALITMVVNLLPTATIQVIVEGDLKWTSSTWLQILRRFCPSQSLYLCSDGKFLTMDAPPTCPACQFNPEAQRILMAAQPDQPGLLRRYNQFMEVLGQYKAAENGTLNNK